MSNFAKLLTCTLFVFGTIGGNFRAQTITDKFGVQHVHNGNNPRHAPFYSNPTKEIYLHNYVISDGWASNYWHAKIIHAGFNLTDHHTLVDDSTVSGMEFQWGRPNGSPATNHTAFKNNNGGKDLNWYQGFFIADGFQDPGVWITNDNTTGFMNGDADLNNTQEWPPNPTNENSGVVIFRAEADGYIDLVDGFRASYNPGAMAYRAIPKRISSVANNTTNIEITVPNHGFVTGDIIFQEEMDGIPVANGLFKVEKTSDNTYKIKDVDCDAYITGAGTYTGSNGRVGLKSAPDNAYFHAYTGDRFACSTAWEAITDIDFTNSATAIGAISDGSSNKFEPMNACKGADAQIDDPVNVYRNWQLPGGGTVLKLSVENDNHSESCYTDKWTSAGIWSNRHDWVTRSDPYDPCNPITSYHNNSRYVLKYGKVEFEAKFPALSYALPQLWLHNDYSVKNLASTSVQYIDYWGPWFQNAWDYDGVNSVTVEDNNQGNNYSAQTTVAFSAPTGTGVTATGEPIIVSGKITGVKIISPGSGYTSAPSVTFNNVGTGSGAVATANLDKSTWGGHVAQVEVTNGGIYTTKPTSVSFTPVNGDPGSGATAYDLTDEDTEEILDNGNSTNPKTFKVKQVKIESAGSGYILPPVVTIVGGEGTAAQARAIVSDRGEDEVYHYLVGTSAGPDYAPYLEVHRGIWACFKQLLNNSNNESFSHTFRNYTAEWLPGELRFLVDGKEIARFTRCIPSKPLGIRAQNFLSRGAAQSGFGIQSENGENNDMFIKHIRIQEFNQSNSCDIIANKQAENKKPKVFSERIPTGITIGSVSPNPAQDKVSVQIKYHTSNSDEFPVAIELYDVLGNVVKQVYDGIEQDPERSYSFITSGLPNGKYYLRVSSGNMSATKSLVIQR